MDNNPSYAAQPSSKGYYTPEGFNAMITAQLNLMMNNHANSWALKTGYPPSSFYPPQELAQMWHSNLVNMAQQGSSPQPIVNPCDTALSGPALGSLGVQTIPGVMGINALTSAPGVVDIKH